MISFRKLGFTLVELIVVITIVGILSTVGFVSYSGYLTGARDSNRISQLVKIGDALQVYSTKNSLPLPDDYVSINASGSLISYQGNAGVDVLETIDYTNGGKDPKDDEYFTYYVTKNRKFFQLMALMEEEKSVLSFDSNETYAANYENRYPKVYGQKLGILTQAITNIPIQLLLEYATIPFDIVSEAGVFTAHFTDTEEVTGSGTSLVAISPNSSCERIKQSGGANGSGNYTINPDGTGDVVVYCDFDNTLGNGQSVSFPTQTIAYNNTQTLVRSTYIDIVSSYSGFNFNQDIPFTLSGQGNPTVSVNGTLTRGTSGVLRDGTNIEIDTPPLGQTYTATVSIPGYNMSFTVIRESEPVATLDLNFGTQTVNYSGRIYSGWKNLPSLVSPTPFTLSGAGSPTAQDSGGSQATSGNIAYGTQIIADAPASGQTRVIQITIQGQTGTFTIIRQ